MRPRKGCDPCRERHVKCERDGVSESCRQCLQNDRLCCQATYYHFRPVTSITVKIDDKRSIKQDLLHVSTQNWVQLPPQIKFADVYTLDTIASTDAFSEVTEQSFVEHVISTVEDTVGVSVTGSSDHDPSMLHSYTDQATDETTDLHNGLSHRYGTSSPGYQFNSENGHKGPELAPGGAVMDDRLSQSRALTPPSILSFKPSWPFESSYEVQLFAHYIEVIAPWLDTCDALSHFEKDVPRRIPYHPILTNSIFALASRRLCLISGSQDTQSPQYANKCITILMETLNDPHAHWDENLLATVVLLRLHEELMHDDDICCHLFGARKMLDSISAFASDGGLREAAAWVSLRQHIYVSLTQQRPLGLTLNRFKSSSVFDETNETSEAWANRIIFIFATILDVAFSSDNSGPTIEVWRSLKGNVDRWYNSKPWDFAPMWLNMNPVNASSPTSTVTTTPGEGSLASHVVKPWPELVMCHRSQVTGLQYYHLARVVLAVYDPELARVGFAAHRMKKASERTVLDAVRNIVGLANSDPHCLNSMFEASHILVTCWSYLHDDAEQNAAIDFLRKVQRKTGWSTRKMVADLEAARLEAPT